MSRALNLAFHRMTVLTTRVNQADAVAAFLREELNAARDEVSRLILEENHPGPGIPPYVGPGVPPAGLRIFPHTHPGAPEIDPGDVPGPVSKIGPPTP